MSKNFDLLSRINLLFLSNSGLDFLPLWGHYNFLQIDFFPRKFYPPSSVYVLSFFAEKEGKKPWKIKFRSCAIEWSGGKAQNFLRHFISTGKKIKVCLWARKNTRFAKVFLLPISKFANAKSLFAKKCRLGSNQCENPHSSIYLFVFTLVLYSCQLNSGQSWIYSCKCKISVVYTAALQTSKFWYYITTLILIILKFISRN